MTIEQIVNTHPCPIIRGKIMENVNGTDYVKYAERLSDLENLLIYNIDDWGATKEGGNFWGKVFDDTTAAYSDLKHLDQSYLPEPAKPLPVWRKIDKDNLPKEKVVAIDIAVNNIVHTGHLHPEDADFKDSGAYLGNTGYGIVIGLTHYIPLSDLINLPIEQ
jgi:hypothetical protein